MKKKKKIAPHLTGPVKTEKSPPSPQWREVLGSQRWARKGAEGTPQKAKEHWLARAWLPKEQKALESWSLSCSAEHSSPLATDLSHHVQLLLGRGGGQDGKAGARYSHQVHRKATSKCHQTSRSDGLPGSHDSHQYQPPPAPFATWGSSQRM